MFQVSNQWIFFGLDISLKVIVLAAFAACTMKLIRIRDPNVRHRVWTGVVGGMLMLPLLALVLPSVPLAVPTAWIGSKAESPTIAEVAPPAASRGSDRRRDTEVFQAAAAPTVEASSSPVLPPAETQRSTPKLPEPVVASSRVERPTLSIPGMLLLGWCVGTTALALRLMIGLWSTSRLIARARRLPKASIDDCLKSLSAGVPHGRLTVRETNEILVPVTVGWLKPTVLLPIEWRVWSDDKLRAVIVHEFTHVARRDFFVVVATEFNRCLYWFHPVSWWLRRRLADLAEEACDDAAIEQTGNPAGYARHLLELASLLTARTGRRIRPSVSMARESNVESRIATILDFKRPLSRRLTWPTATAIILVSAVVITSAAALRPVRAVEPADEVASTVTAEATTQPGNGSGNESADETVRVHGQVTNEQGQPLANARVRLYRIERSVWYAAGDDATLIQELNVGTDGRFDDNIDRSVLNQGPGGWRVLVVSAKGFAHATFNANPAIRVKADGTYKPKPDFMKDPIEAKLIPQVPVRGRILSIEGQPIANATVSIFQLERADPNDLDQWIARAKEKPLITTKTNRMMMMGATPKGKAFPSEHRLHLPEETVETVSTDRLGAFEIAGVGRDDAVVLRIRGDGITNAMVHVLGREMETIYARHVIRTSTAGTYYGRTFDFVAQPSVPVYGVVRDVQTKAPLVDIPVAVGSVYGTIMSHTGHIVTRTDGEGRYRIEGLPIPPRGTRKGDRNSLSVRPGQLPYIETHAICVPLGDGVNPIEFNIELRRAVMAKGRITDRSTGKPIKAELYYTPFLSNDHTDKYQRFSDNVRMMLGNDTRYHSDTDGFFQIPVIPGRGVLAAKVFEGEFIAGYGKKLIEEFRDDKGGLSPATSDHIVISQYHSIKEIDAPENVNEMDVAMEVDRGESVTVHFVDPEGEPLQNVGVSGHDSRRGHAMFNDDHSEAVGLVIGEVRPMTFTHRKRGLFRLYRLIPKKGQTDVTVTLFPQSIVSGRLVDPEGRPLPDLTLEARHDNTPNSIATLAPVTTDTDGRFEYLVNVGATFTILGRTEKFVKVASGIKVASPQRIDLGDVTIDPDAERWADAIPKRAPIVTDLPTTIPSGAPSTRE